MNDFKKDFSLLMVVRSIQQELSCHGRDLLQDLAQQEELIPSQLLPVLLCLLLL